MAYFFQKSGWKDITIAFPYNPRENKLIDRLSKKVRLTLTVSGAQSAAILANQIKGDIEVMIKIDTGYNRSGVQWDNTNEVSKIIDIISTNPSVHVKGLLTHSGNTYGISNREKVISIYQESVIRLNKLKNSINDKDLLISVGDTPSSSLLSNFGEIDELRPGNFVFYDYMQYYAGVCLFEEIGAVMACPIVDIRHSNGTIVVHGGAVHLSKDNIDTGNGKRFGLVVRLSENGWAQFEKPCYVISLSQEHGIIECPPDILNKYSIGDLIGIVPVHSCLTADLAGGYLLTNGEVIDHINEKRFK
jgi:D-serine deaminase-like pyridoxal phosphate-dependent protein